MKKAILTAVFALMSVAGVYAQNYYGRSSSLYGTSSSVQTRASVNDQYLNNSLYTGASPYSCSSCYGSESSITVKTSSQSGSDVVVMVKRGGVLVKNAYIKAGGSYTFNLPNGQYQVFFYGGRGWNPNKVMPNGARGGFVDNESYSKDDPTNLEYQGLTYELISRPNGNFSTKQCRASEIF